MTNKRKPRRRDEGTEADARPGAPVSRPRPGIAAALAGLTVLVGLVAAILQPWDPLAPGCENRTPPDETAHLVYVRRLLTERALPVLTVGGGNYEAHQPPLYYLSALPAAIIGRAVDPPGQHRKRPTDGEVMAQRAWSVLIAAGVIVGCYLVACVVFPRSLLLQIGVPLFALLLPGHIINLAAVTNDGLAELLCCLAFWLAVGLIRTPAEGVGRFAALGAVTGAALLTKTSCLLLLPVGLVAALMACSPWSVKPASWRRLALRAALCTGLPLLMWAPWIAHNLAHYPGDPLVTRTFVEIFGQDRATPDTFYAMGMSAAGYLRLVLVWTYLSFWGVFGGAMVFMPGWYYPAGTLVTVAALVGIARGLGRWRRAPGESRFVWSLLALGGILVALQFLRFNATFFQAQARYLFPAIAPIACAFVGGLELAGARFGGERGARWLLGICGAIIAVMLVCALVEVASRGPVGPPAWLI